MLSYNDRNDFQKGLMQNVTEMDPKTAVTAADPEETRRDSFALAAGSAAKTTGTTEAAAEGITHTAKNKRGFCFGSRILFSVI